MEDYFAKRAESLYDGKHIDDVFPECKNIIFLIFWLTIYKLELILVGYQTGLSP